MPFAKDVLRLFSERQAEDKSQRGVGREQRKLNKIQGALRGLTMIISFKSVTITNNNQCSEFSKGSPSQGKEDHYPQDRMWTGQPGAYEGPMVHQMITREGRTWRLFKRRNWSSEKINNLPKISLWETVLQLGLSKWVIAWPPPPWPRTSFLTWTVAIDSLLDALLTPFTQYLEQPPRNAHYTLSLPSSKPFKAASVP